MAFNQRNKRKITVGENVFFWLYKFEEEALRLIILTDEKTHSRLICDLKYKNLNLYFRELIKNDDFYKDKFLMISAGVLTPWVVRQVIDYALEKGWKPFEKGADFVITDIEDKIDINFWTETTAEERKTANPKSKI